MMKECNVFDFDGTLYRGDSSVDFYLYCLRHYPYIVFLLPTQIIGFLLYTLKLWNKTQMKRCFYYYLPLVPVEKALSAFWKGRLEQKIFPWYREIQSPTDVVVSASPEFLLAPACKELGIQTLIASRVNPRTGEYTGLNCGGEEKARRFQEQLPNVRIQASYFDRDSDRFISALAQEAFRIVDGKPHLEEL